MENSYWEGQRYRCRAVELIEEKEEDEIAEFVKEYLEVETNYYL